MFFFLKLNWKTTINVELLSIITDIFGTKIFIKRYKASELFLFKRL